MNLELLEKMTQLLEERRNRRSELANEYQTATGEDIQRIYNEVDNIVKGNNRIKKAIKNVRNANSKLENAQTQEEIERYSEELTIAEENLELLAEEFNVTFNQELPVEEAEEETESQEIVGEETQTEERKNNTARNIILGTLTLATVAGLSSCVTKKIIESEVVSETTQNNNDEEEKIETELEEAYKNETESKEEMKVEEVDVKLYGMTGAFTDVNDEKQLMQRANDIYNVYVNTENMPEAMKQQLSVERIANFIRMCNGEFALEDGQIDYNGSMFDEMGNFINSYHNATSFVEFKTNLEFKPTCIFFENDSLAHHSAAKADELVKAIYEDIRNNDVDKFQKDAMAWGEFVRDTVIYNDFTGETISLWSMENEHKYPLLKSLTSVYAPSIMEYSIGVDLARRDNSTGQYADTFGICIPFCYNAENELEYMPISEMIYHINETPMNYLAKRAGFEEEWNKENDSIMVMAGLTTKSYFDSKYELEVGNSLKLK